MTMKARLVVLLLSLSLSRRQRQDSLFYPSLTAAQECTAEDGTSTCTNANDNNHQQRIECGVYMAPSTIGDNSNLGIFAGKHMKKGDQVPYPEILIPLLWRIFGQHPEKSLKDGLLWDRYIWEQHVGEIEPFDDLERSKEKSSCFFPGVGCTVNSMLDLRNIQSVQGSQFDEIVDRNNPGAGAFTPYHSAPTIISADKIEPGQELFAAYGDEWIPWIPGVAVTKYENFEKADELMHQFEEWIEEHEAPASPTKGELTDELLKGMWKFMVDFPQSSRPLSVLPKEWNRENLKRAKIKSKQRELAQEEIKSPTSEYWEKRGKVSLDFLEQHGKCQDHLRPGMSTIPSAGRGAFASRDLPEGTVVGYAPLIHMAVRGDEVVTVDYDGVQHGSKDIQTNNFSRPDLVLNYSFGHRNSTLLLTPYGSMVNYINHKNNGDGDGDGPNVRLQWPSRELVAHKPDWLDKDIIFLRDTVDKIGLSFDYVALRDIKAGEEILLDYGDEWIEAWEDHVKNWVPPKDADGYVHSSLFNLEYLKTPEEQRSDPYPWNLHTLCTNSFKKTGAGRYRYMKPGQKHKEKLPCRVVERVGSNSVYVYTVELDHPDEGRIVVHDYPRQDYGVDLYDKAYSPMWHMENAFRHKMYIPDDMFPEHWMN